MDIVPSIRVTRFEQLEPGDLFIYVDERQKFYALKTQKPSDHERSLMVLLGPTFIEGIKGSWLAPWQPSTVLSLGKNFAILPSLDPASWSLNGPSRDTVCLAIADENVYICTNGSERPERYIECFVDTRTGAILEGRPPRIAVFTGMWEIAVLGINHPPRTILKFRNLS
jgi:hypothetical protein